MDFTWTDDQQAFRAELAGLLDEIVPAGYQNFDLAEEEWAERSKDYCGRLADAGWLTPAWPVEYGGRGADGWQQLAVAEEMILHGEPRGGQYMNVNFIGPSIMMFGTEEQKAYHLKRISRGDVIWCQGFSEPDAGSDLASLRTRAVPDGDHFVIDGEKIWTSNALIAEYCMLLARTDPQAAKHAGITVFLLPMDTPGVEVRKIPGVVGEGAFHEVVLTDARVPDSIVLGEVNQGWPLIRRALAFERVGVARYARAEQYLDEIVGAARERGLLDQTRIRAEIARAQAACDMARVLVWKVIDDRERGRPDSPTAYVYRSAAVRAERAVMEVAFQVLGTDGLEDHTVAHRQFKWGMTAGVASGTAEVQLNLIARLALGLPKPV
ncbi:acyl-CoA dehydrogenase family protein [Pseudonocardia sp. NPDC049154]|uniref:acyl-CoA dehydrogenase family protein n=1 Tax=Pseudonocardia sp. NPDC049154 TaxID=3155501 RepID=UPI00340AA9B0